MVVVVALGALSHYRWVPSLKTQDGAAHRFRLNSGGELALAAASWRDGGAQRAGARVVRRRLRRGADGAGVTRSPQPTTPPPCAPI